MDDETFAAGCGGVILGILCVVCWIVHIVRCYLLAEWWFLIWGSVIFPVGIVHGGWFLFRQIVLGGV